MFEEEIFKRSFIQLLITFYLFLPVNIFLQRRSKVGLRLWLPSQSDVFSFLLEFRNLGPGHLGGVGLGLLGHDFIGLRLKRLISLFLLGQSLESFPLGLLLFSLREESNFDICKFQ